VLAIAFVIKKRDTSFQPSQIRLNTMTEIPFKAVLVGAVAGIAVATFYCTTKYHHKN
jgi:hypothetical protein